MRLAHGFVLILIPSLAQATLSPDPRICGDKDAASIPADTRFQVRYGIGAVKSDKRVRKLANQTLRFHDGNAAELTCSVLGPSPALAKDSEITLVKASPAAPNNRQGVKTKWTTYLYEFKTAKGQLFNIQCDIGPEAGPRTSDPRTSSMSAAQVARLLGDELIPRARIGDCAAPAQPGPGTKPKSARRI